MAGISTVCPLMRSKAATNGARGPLLCCDLGDKRESPDDRQGKDGCNSHTKDQITNALSWPIAARYKCRSVEDVHLEHFPDVNLRKAFEMSTRKASVLCECIGFTRELQRAALLVKVDFDTVARHKFTSLSASLEHPRHLSRLVLCHQ